MLDGDLESLCIRHVFADNWLLLLNKNDFLEILLDEQGDQCWQDEALERVMLTMDGVEIKSKLVIDELEELEEDDIKL